jgi:hypothetical protein
MKSIEQISEIKLLNNENILLDSKIQKILWETDPKTEELSIIIILIPQFKRYKGKVLLKCTGIQLVQLYTEGEYLGCVERYKLLTLPGNRYYLSLDPYDENSIEESNLDNMVVICKDITRSLIDKI